MRFFLEISERLRVGDRSIDCLFRFYDRVVVAAAANVVVVVNVVVTDPRSSDVRKSIFD